MTQNSGIHPKLERIIIKCQHKQKEYGFDYEEKYKIEIKKFSRQIVEQGLIELCDNRLFAKQLCIKNCLTYDTESIDTKTS